MTSEEWGKHVAVEKKVRAEAIALHGKPYLRNGKEAQG